MTKCTKGEIEIESFTARREQQGKLIRSKSSDKTLHSSPCWQIRHLLRNQVTLFPYDKPYNLTGNLQGKKRTGMNPTCRIALGIYKHKLCNGVLTKKDKICLTGVINLFRLPK